jgi:glycerol-3-phosphate dehydrogenase
MPHRADTLARLAATPVDVLVVGGGITGAGVAHDAAARGLAVALVERDDLAAGTSSRSSRLVHGGVRYLEHGWLHLVFEASRERRRLLDNAPHLVRPLGFTWPVYDGQRLAKWEVGAGLLLYDVLALYRNVGTHKRLSRARVLATEPALRADGLVGGAQYWDAATDDARLTLAAARAAESHGAAVVTQAEVVALTWDAGRVAGAVVRDRETGREWPVRANVVVNATGPWTHKVLRLERAAAPPAVRGTKGVHITVPRARLGNRGAVTLLHPDDERVMFALPAGDHAILGTTDTRTEAPPDQVRADRADVRYLLTAANHWFPAARLTDDDVISAWAGIRPLIAAAGGAAPSDQSREHEVAVGLGGVITVSGGKLTTFRAMAEEVVDVACERLGRAAPSTTARAPLPGGTGLDRIRELAAAVPLVGDAAVAARLVHAHGTAWRDVWALGDADPTLRARITPESPAILAEAVWAARHEHARAVADVLVRRTQVAYDARDHGVGAAATVAGVMAPELRWDAVARAAAVERYHAEVARLFAIDDAAAPRGHGDAEEEQV